MTTRNWISRVPHPLILLSGMIVFAMLLTQFVPAGSFERLEQAGRDIIIPGTYSEQPASPVGIWGMFRAVPDGFAKAARANPNWGRPYMMIGRLYASSGPLCGPGTGFDSQVVVWVAIDQWRRAKQVDPSFTAEANALINRYIEFMPFREDLHQRSIALGSTYTVGCWINESTIVRVNQ